MNGKSRAWALALLVAVFLVGGAAGAAVDRTLLVDRSVSSDQGRRSGDRADRRRSYLDWLAAELQLSEQQKTEVQAILEQHREHVSQVWGEMRPKYEELQEQARAEIRALLSEEQMAAYDALLERQREREQRNQARRHDDNREEPS
jgi:protein CpxP